MMLAAIQIGYAAPPDVGSEDYEILTPHSAWLHEQKNPTTGVGCCDLSDCRTVDWRAVNDKIEMFISSSKYVEGPDEWVSVPSSVIHKDENPTGKAVACWSAWRQQDNGFYCVWLPPLT